MSKVYFQAGAAILCWSTVATISKLLLGSYNSFQVLWISSLVAAIFLLFVNIINKNIRELKKYKLSDYAVTLAAGLPGSFFYYMFYYAGTDILPASQAFIINYLWPIMSVFFAWVILGEKMTGRKITAIAVSFVGVGIVSGADILSFNKHFLLGALFCILGAVSYGMFVALNKKIKYNNSLSVMISYAGTFLITTVINFVNGDLFIPTVSALPGIIWNSVFTVAIANTLWVNAVESGNTAKVSNLAYITPFLSIMWTFVILKEEISKNSIIGLFVIMLGIIIQLKSSERGEKLVQNS